MNDLLNWFFQEDVSFEQFRQWYERPTSPSSSRPQTPSPRPSPSPPPPYADQKYNYNDLIALKPELGLSVVNFIREQAEDILERSQRCLPSPAKTPHPAKYDYSSPVKSSRKRILGKTEKGEEVVKKDKKRAQLFSPSEGETAKSLSRDDDDDLGVMVRLDDNTEKISKLEERFTEVSELKQNKRLSLGSDIKLNLNDKTKKNSNGRRSLDSMLSQQNNKTLASRPKANSKSPGSNITLGDYMVQKKPKKKKNLSPVQKSNDEKSGSQRNNKLVSIGNSNDLSSEEYSSRPLPQEPIVDKRPEKIQETVAKASKVAKEPEEFVNKDIWSQVVKSIEATSPKKTSTEIDPQRNLKQPDLLLVTHKVFLDKLILLYCYCIDQNLILNLSAELYLLIELLLVHEEEQGSDRTTDSKLNTIHNCVYFSGQVLSNQTNILRYLDVSVLNLLKATDRIQKFTPDILKNAIDQFLVESSLQKKLVLEHEDQETSQKASLESVRFHSEVDSSSNFPSDRAFQDFKKQRDLFYEILRDWKTSDEVIDSKESKKLSSETKEKIVHLVRIQRHPTNMLHLARLFCNQMVVTCSNEIFENEKENTIEFEDAALKQKRRQLKKIDPQILKCLEKRLSHSDSGSGTTKAFNLEKESFQGAEHFFREFLGNCNDFSFLTYVRRVLVDLITTHEDHMASLELGEGKIKSELAPSTLAKISIEFRNTLVTLRICGKFLGFVDAVPFMCQQETLSEIMLREQIKIREQIPPPLDLKVFVARSLQQRRLVGTIPWVVDLITNLDPIALQSRYYQPMIELLSHIHRAVLRKSNPVYPLHPRNAFFLNVILGELFENPLIPREVFFNFSHLSQKTVERIWKDSEFYRNTRLDETDVLLGQKPSSLLRCSTYLTDLKLVLIQFSGESPSKSSNVITTASQKHRIQVEQSFQLQGRKITASELKLDESKTKSRDPKTHLQSQLERNFFHNHQDSFLKSVTFIAERIGWKMISLISSETIMDGINKEVEKHYQECIGVAFGLSTGDPKTDITDKHKIKAELMLEIQDFSKNYYFSTHQKCRQAISTHLPGLVNAAITALMPTNISLLSKNICIKVAERKATAQTIAWIRETLTERFFYKSFAKIFLREWRLAEVRLEQKLFTLGGGSFPEESISKTYRNPGVENANEMSDMVQRPATVMIEVQEIKRKLMENSRADNEPSISPDYVLKILNNFKECFAHKANYEVSPVALKALEQQSVDFAIILIAYCPTMFQANVQEAMVNLWLLRCMISPSMSERLSDLISPRNVYLLHECSTSPRDTWSRLEHFLGRLLNADLVFPMVLEAQCLQMTRTTWKKELLRNFASCMRGVVDSWKREWKGKNKCDQEEEMEFEQLMDWLVWFWQDVEDMDEEFPALS